MTVIQDTDQTLQRRAGCYELIEELSLTLARPVSAGDDRLWLEPAEPGIASLLPAQFLYLGQGYQEVRLIRAVERDMVRVERLQHSYAAGSPVLRPAQYQLGAA